MCGCQEMPGSALPTSLYSLETGSLIEPETRLVTNTAHNPVVCPHSTGVIRARGCTWIILWYKITVILLPFMILWSRDPCRVWLDLFYPECCWLWQLTNLSWWLLCAGEEIQDGFTRASGALAKAAVRMFLLEYVSPFMRSQRLLEVSSLGREIEFLLW